MKTEIGKYTSKPVLVTPFGVDVANFCNRPAVNKPAGITYIGTIKPIEEKYGIIYIIEAAQLLIEKDKTRQYKFWLIGSGHDLGHYQKIVDEKGLTPYFEITGRIPFSEISNYHNLMDIFLNVSIDDSESFGVAAVEAMACEKPVIVSDVGGLMEVVNQGEFGIVIKKKDPVALANAIESLLNDKAAAEQLGKSARQHVLRHYDWQNNLQNMIKAYQDLISKKEAVTS